MKTPLMAVPLLKKRLRRINSIGFEKLNVKEWNFTVFFSLHQDENSDAFYISESIKNEHNPEWSNFEFPNEFQCLQEFHLIVWIRSSKSIDDRKFLGYDVCLDNILVPDVQKGEISTSSNRLWIEMFGYRFTDSTETSSILNEQPISFVKSYNRSSLLRMMNVVHAIQIGKKSSQKCLEQIENLLENQQELSLKMKERESRRIRIESIRQCLSSQRRICQQREIFLEEKRKDLENRRRQHSLNLMKLSKYKQETQHYSQRLEKSQSTLTHMKMFLIYRQKVLIREISEFIYPIDQDQTNQYGIVGLKLPISDDKIYETISYRDKEIITALEFTAHFLMIISSLTFYPLRYPIERQPTTPIRIFDQAFDNKEFVLDPSVDLQSFQCAFLLLNRNIVQMMQHFHIGKRRPDYRKTLENLKTFIDHFLYQQSPCLTKDSNETR